MHLTAKFYVLLVSVVAVFLTEAAAAPTSRQVTIPIRSLHGHAPRDIHPQLYLQQHINRADRRLARMTGRAMPSDEELRDRLHKRMYLVGGGAIRPGRMSGTPSKRYNSVSIPSLAAPLALEALQSGTAAQGISPLDIQADISGGLTAANPPATSNSIGLNIEAADSGYVAEVQFGTPPRAFQILMDSGSADLWVGSEHCQSLAGGGCGSHQFLGTNSSSSFVDTKVPFNVTYGTGQVAGTIVNDTVTLAGLTLKGHSFGTADTESIEFSSDNTKFDGLMGLAQSGLSNQGNPTPVEALYAQGLIPAAIASYKISRLADQKNDGQITLGTLDTTKFDPATLVTFPNTNPLGFWEGSMGPITVSGQDTGLQKRTAILDTGTTLIIAPPSDAAALHQLIPGAKPDGHNGFTVPCTTNASVALTFGGRSFAIDPRDLAVFPVDPKNLVGDCISGIGSGSIGGVQNWLVGDVFLKNAYFSTNVNNNSISLAKLV